MVDIKRILAAWWMLIVVVISSVCVNIAQLVTWYALLPFTSNRTRLALSQALANYWWNLFCFGFEYVADVNYVFTGDKVITECAILMANHCTGLDFTNGVVVTSRAPFIGCGHMMTMMKASLKFAPTVGWMHTLQGSLFLKRKLEQDASAIKEKLNDMEENRFPRPFWLGVYPEGTRITPTKLAESQAFAQKTGQPVLQNVLFPRTKGFVLLASTLKKSIDSIYDVTIAYEDGNLTKLQDLLLNGKFKTKSIHIHIRRVPMSSIARDETSLDRWLVDTWAAKDKLLQYFKLHKEFPGARVDYPSQENEFRTLFIAWSCFISLLFLYCFGMFSVSFLLSLLLQALTLSISLQDKHHTPSSSNKPPLDVYSENAVRERGILVKKEQK